MARETKTEGARNASTVGKVAPSATAPVATPNPSAAARQKSKPKVAAATKAKSKQKSAGATATFEPAEFSDMPGWDADDHLAALRAFVTSCGRVAAAVKAGARIGKTNPTPELLAVCEAAERLSAAEPTRKTARAFFEEAFRPHRVLHRSETGLLTGYYEPLVEGSRVKDATFSAPLLRRPGDLVNLVSEAERGAVGERLTHARKDGAGWTPYPTRREIEEGALSGNDLELIYLRDPVDVFFMQVQGSGLVALPDGGKVRVTYDGKNGHPYTSIGRYLIDQGLFPADRMSLQALKRWLRANPERMRDVLWQNQSYVFFRELSGDEATAPRGVLEIPLTPGRSLAVDTAFHVIGTPIYVSSQRLVHATRKPGGFHRLMIAQDVGSAIRGPERGDIYFGSGHHAGSIAGVTKHPGNFYVLLPRQQAGQRDKPPRNRAVPRDTLIDAALPTRKPVRQARQ